MAGKMAVRVVQYNVLSPALCYRGYFCDDGGAALGDEHIDAAARLRAVLAKLGAECARGAVVALEEVPLKWTGRLHAFFAERRYHFVCTAYGGESSDFFGAGLAWDTARYRATDGDAVSVVRVSETADGWPRADWEPYYWGPRTSPAKPGPRDHLRSAWESVAATQLLPEAVARRRMAGVRLSAQPHHAVALIAGALAWLAQAPALLAPAVAAAVAWALRPAPKTYCPWKEAKQRPNRAVMARLQQTDGDPRPFVVACYHMPCLFGAPAKVAVMNVHAALLAHEVARFARGAPYVIATDFNSKPDSSPYELLTAGTLPDTCPDVMPLAAPSPLAGNRLGRILVVPRLRSAYAAAGGEPARTNHCRTQWDKEPFSATLDYIFISPEWGVDDVIDVSHITPTHPMLPHLSAAVQEPSDHLMIGATLALQ